MKTGTFAIDYMQVGIPSIGSADLNTEADGVLTAQITVLAPDGEFYSYYWLGVNPAQGRIEYEHFDEIEGETVLGGAWAISDVSACRPADEDEMLAAFAAMAHAASDLDITPLQVGSDIETLGGPLSQEDLDELGPLWAPAADEP